MNSRCVLFVFIFFAFTACGVKSKPLNPPEVAIKSYLDSYTSPVDKKDKIIEQKKK